MKKTKIIALILSAMLAVSAMTACSGSGENNGEKTEKTEASDTVSDNASDGDDTQDADSSLVGKYTMTSYIKDGEPVDLTDNNAKGVYSTIEIKDDFTGEFDLFGIKSDVTVDGENITLAGSQSTYTLSGDSLTVVNGATVMVFKRGEGAAVVAADSQPTVDSTDSQPAVESSVPAETSAAPTESSASSDADSSVSVTKGEWQNIEWEDYTDPNGLFTAVIPKGWKVTSSDGQADGKVAGLLVTIQSQDEKQGAQVFDYTTISSSIMTEPTVESLVNALYSTSTELEILDVSTPDYMQQIKDANPDTVLDAKVVHMNYTKNGIEYECNFLGFVNKSLISGTYSATTMWAGFAPRGQYENWVEIITKIQSSIKYTDKYTSRYSSSSGTSGGTTGGTTGGTVTGGGSSYDMTDAMMDSWNARNKSEDIMSQKQSDATLGYERVYDTETGDIYRADSGFMEEYDKLDGQRYAAATDDMYTEGYSGYISMD